MAPLERAMRGFSPNFPGQTPADTPAPPPTHNTPVARPQCLVAPGGLVWSWPTFSMGRGDPRCPGLPPRGGHAGRSVVRGPPMGAEIAGNSELGTDGAHTARVRRGRPASLAPLVLAELRPEQGSARP